MKSTVIKLKVNIYITTNIQECFFCFRFVPKHTIHLEQVFTCAFFKSVVNYYISEFNITSKLGNCLKVTDAVLGDSIFTV